MRTMATTVHNWLVTHPIAWGLVLFFLSCIVSLYSKQIRELLHTWPSRTLSRYDKNININRLRLVERLHNNTYELVLYLALSAVGIVDAAIIWNGVLLAASLILFHSTKDTSVQLQGTLFGIGVGKALQVGDVLKQLANYDASTAYMGKIIAAHEQREALGLNPPESAG